MSNNHFSYPGQEYEYDPPRREKPIAHPKIVRVLAEFFLDSFAEDPSGVADWLAQGGQDVDSFYAAAENIKAAK